MSQVSSSYACSLHFAFVNKSSKSLLPLYSNSKPKGEAKTVRSKCLALWGRLTPSTNQNMPCGSHLNSKNNYLPTFSASQKPMSSTRWKSSETKHNYLTHNYLIGNNPVYSGWASKGLVSTNNTGFLTPNGDICHLYRCFCACKSLSWADAVDILSSINDKKDAISSSINDKVARVRNSVRTPR